MPPTLRQHVRYPELMLQLQATVYGLYHMTESRGVLQPRGSLDRRQRSRHDEPRAGAPQASGAELRADEAAGREARLEFVEMLPFTPANRNNLIGWIAGRSDEPHYGTAGRLQLPEDKARRWSAADRSADRSERAALRPVVAVESAGIERQARQPAGHSDWPRAPLRGADLSAGRTQPDAGAPHRRAGAPGPARLRSDVSRRRSPR